MVVKELLLETTYGLTAPAILAMALAALCPVARISVVKTKNAEKKAETNKMNHRLWTCTGQTQFRTYSLP